MLSNYLVSWTSRGRETDVLLALPPSGPSGVSVARVSRSEGPLGQPIVSALPVKEGIHRSEEETGGMGPAFPRALSLPEESVVGEDH